MAEWPKTILVRGIGIPIGSWEELDEIIERYGERAATVIQAEKRPRDPRGRRGRSLALSHTDRALLQQFVEGGARGVTTGQLGPALGERGKRIRPALEAWSRRVGLVTQQGASAFEPVKRADGRGFRLTDLSLRAARSILRT